MPALTRPPGPLIELFTVNETPTMLKVTVPPAPAALVLRVIGPITTLLPLVLPSELPSLNKNCLFAWLVASKNSRMPLVQTLRVAAGSPSEVVFPLNGGSRFEW